MEKLGPGDEDLIRVADRFHNVVRQLRLRKADEALVLGHRAGDKVVVFKYKAKSRYRRKYGPRPRLTELKISAIHRPGSDGRPAAVEGEARRAGETAKAAPARGRRKTQAQDKE